MSHTRQQISQLWKERHFFKAGKLLLATAARRCGSAFYRNVNDLVITWDLNDSRPARNDDRLSVESAGEESLADIAQLCRQHRLPRRIYRKVHNYLENGFQGWLFKTGNETVGFIWCVDHTIPPRNNHPSLLLYEITLQPGEVYMFDNFLVPEHRGRGNANHVLEKIRVELKRRGYHKAVAYVSADNQPAVWTYRIHGWKTERKCAQHQICGMISIVNGRIFRRNNRWSRPHSFDYRPVFPRRKVNRGEVLQEATP
jgi:ribosomal protein S18 acetylase RimI-like enzyme